MALGALGGKAGSGNGIVPASARSKTRSRRSAHTTTLWKAAAKGDVTRLRRWFALPRTLRPRPLQGAGGVDTRDLVTGFTALMLASVNGHVDAARLLLEQGASPNATEAGQSALALAAANARAGVVRLLLQCGADPTFASGRHARQDFCSTLFFHGSCDSSDRPGSSFLRRCCSAHLRQGMTPAQLAAGSGSAATVAAILDSDTSQDRKWVLAAGHPPYQFDSDSVNRLLEERYDAHIRAVVERVFQPELARNGGMVPVASVLDKKFGKEKERQVLNRLRELSKEYR